jgi:hypothetical protein
VQPAALLDLAVAGRLLEAGERRAQDARHLVAREQARAATTPAPNSAVRAL